MPANLQELNVAFGKKRQATVGAAQLAADLWRLAKVNGALMAVTLGTENDADWIGKGHEYAENVYNTAWDVSGTMEKFASSEWLCWAFGMALGNVSEAAGTYTIKPTEPVVDDTIELALFNMVEQVRPGGSPYVDRAVIGCCVNDLTLTIRRGPGLQNCTCTVNFVGTGKLVEPSTIDLEAVPLTAEHILSAGSATVTINGTDYVAGGALEELTMTWANNVRRESGYFIGSGYQTPGNGLSGQIRGRMEHAKREPGLTFVARLAAGSPELTKLKAGTTGAATITLTFSATESFSITWHKVRFSSVQPADAEGLMTVTVEAQPLYKDATNQLVSITAKTAVADIAA